MYQLEIDCNLDMRDDGMVALPQHPFQRYTALSYVWGSPEDPLHIVLNGKTRFPVTRNLHAALHSLRSQCDSTGRMLWVDAVCINQADHTEKENQLRLMQRVYQQAEEVVAYLPQTVEDQSNLHELLNKIKESYMLYERDLVEQKTKGEEAEEMEESEMLACSLSPGTDETGSAVAELQEDMGKLSFFDAFALAQAKAREHSKNHPEARFIEDFGLPPTNSPLWTSWRRLFASPYCES